MIINITDQSSFLIWLDFMEEQGYRRLELIEDYLYSEDGTTLYSPKGGEGDGICTEGQQYPYDEIEGDGYGDGVNGNNDGNGYGNSYESLGEDGGDGVCRHGIEWSK